MASSNRLILLGAQALSLARSRGFTPCKGLIVRRPFLYRQISQSTKDSKVKSVEERLEDSMDRLNLQAQMRRARDYNDMYLKTWVEEIQGTSSAIKTAKKEFVTGYFYLMSALVPIYGAAAGFALNLSYRMDPTS